jgi:L-aspartate oxidase
MQYNQFHPTCLHTSNDNKSRFLISEAVRGEGGILLDEKFNSFMEKFYNQELVTRDKTSIAIYKQISTQKNNFVFLDISHKDENFIKKTFPSIYKHCLSQGIDITKEYIPVSPGSHYTCGGIETKINGETNVKNLYAVGEVANSGFHGANRLASNSLLECMVVGDNAAISINNRLLCEENNSTKYIEKNYLNFDIPEIKSDEVSKKIKKLMWDKVGVVKNYTDLKSALKTLESIQKEISKGCKKNEINLKYADLNNLIQVCILITKDSIKSKINIGLYYNIDIKSQQT